MYVCMHVCMYVCMYACEPDVHGFLLLVPCSLFPLQAGQKPSLRDPRPLYFYNAALLIVAMWTSHRSLLAELCCCNTAAHSL